MAENIAKIDEKIRELKRKKKTAENREKIKRSKWGNKGNKSEAWKIPK